MFFSLVFPTVSYLALALYLSGVSGIVARNTLLALLALLLPHVVAEARHKVVTPYGAASLLLASSRVAELLLHFRFVCTIRASIDLAHSGLGGNTEGRVRALQHGRVCALLHSHAPVNSASS